MARRTSRRRSWMSCARTTWACSASPTGCVSPRRLNVLEDFVVFAWTSKGDLWHVLSPVAVVPPWGEYYPRLCTREQFEKLVLVDVLLEQTQGGLALASNSYGYGGHFSHSLRLGAGGPISFTASVSPESEFVRWEFYASGEETPFLTADTQFVDMHWTRAENTVARVVTRPKDEYKLRLETKVADPGTPGDDCPGYIVVEDARTIGGISYHGPKRYYPKDGWVRLRPVANPGYRFVEWQTAEDVTGAVLFFGIPFTETGINEIAEERIAVRMDDDITITAVFKWDPVIEMITPAGDPVNKAMQSGDGQNEFTYSTASPGILTMNLKARVTPSCVADLIKDQCRFTVHPIAGSTLVWDTANPGGKPTVSGDELLATVRFTGLPANNTAFGRKKAAIYFNASKKDEENYEVFFPRDEANNPGGSDPNWFYYWSQVYVNANVHYVAAAGTGQTPAMTAWNYNLAASKTRIEIGDGHPAKYASYGVGEVTSGIDRYIMTVIHEEKHVAQIAAADALLPTSGADSFRFGWSWNQATHNHWAKGPDKQWGVAGTDDDGNGIVDDAAIAPPFEPGNGDDGCLNRIYANGYNNWPSLWLLPGGIYGSPRISPIEGEAVKAADDAMNENDYAPQDWGDPGKNHKTVNKWDD